MRILFFILVALLALWAIRRITSRRPSDNTPATPAQPQAMVACLHCGMHLPRDEAVSGTLGLYCCTAHRSAAGDRNPG